MFLSPCLLNSAPSRLRSMQRRTPPVVKRQTGRTAIQCRWRCAGVLDSPSRPDSGPSSVRPRSALHTMDASLPDASLRSRPARSMHPAPLGRPAVSLAVRETPRAAACLSRRHVLPPLHSVPPSSLILIPMSWHPTTKFQYLSSRPTHSELRPPP